MSQHEGPLATLTPNLTRGARTRAGRVGSAFAAELGTMAVSEQTDSLRVLGSDPVDYLITPRTLACMIAGPILNLMCFVMGELLHFGPKSVDCH